MRRLVAIPLFRSESRWNGIDPKLGILVYDADDESDVDDRILDQPLDGLASPQPGEDFGHHLGLPHGHGLHGIRPDRTYHALPFHNLRVDLLQ